MSNSTNHNLLKIGNRVLKIGGRVLSYRDPRTIYVNDRDPEFVNNEYPITSSVGTDEWYVVDFKISFGRDINNRIQFCREKNNGNAMFQIIKNGTYGVGSNPLYNAFQLYWTLASGYSKESSYTVRDNTLRDDDWWATEHHYQYMFHNYWRQRPYPDSSYNYDCYMYLDGQRIWYGSQSQGQYPLTVIVRTHADTVLKDLLIYSTPEDPRPDVN